MAAGWYYRYAGLWVASELDIPEWSTFETQKPPADADVWVRLNVRGQPAGPVPGEFTLNISETAHYRVARGQEIEITPHPGAGEREIRLFLLGSAWGALCYQRGLLAIHASVVQMETQTVAFCGPSGAGKSTLAASLVQQNRGRLISDDLCCIELGAQVARVYPSAPRLKLWRTALDHLGLDPVDLVQDHFRLDKFHLAQKQADSFPDPLRLDGIYLLAWGEPGLHRLRGMQAVSRLVGAATYHPELLESIGCARAHWERCLQLVRLTPVWELSRPKNWSEVGWPPGPPEK